MIRPQKEFPLLAEYKKVFPITPQTIFAWNGSIFCDYDLPNHLIVHEETHLKQQEEIGLEKWVKQYLKKPEFRLKMELEAYRKQLTSIKDRELRNKVRIHSAKALSSDLYGDVINFTEAFKLLK